MVVADWFRMAPGRPPRIGHVPYLSARQLPILWAPTPTAGAPLRPVAEDDPGEMGGRVASLTFVGRVEELQTLDAVRGGPQMANRPSSRCRARLASARHAWLLS
jgi:hypothetical protein